MLKVLAIGAGYFARFHHEAWSRMPGARLAGIVDLDLAKARDAAGAVGAVGAVPAFDDLAAALTACRPEIVDIATPPASHLALIDAVYRAAADGRWIAT